MFTFNPYLQFRNTLLKVKTVHHHFTRSLFLILFFLGKKNGFRLSLLFAVIILVSLLKGIIPVIFKNTVDDLVSGSVSAYASIGGYFVIFLFCFCSLYLLEPIKNFISQRLLISSESNLLVSFVQKINNADYSFLLKWKLSVISHFLEKAISSLKKISEGLLLQLIPNLLDLCIIFLMLSINLNAKYSLIFFVFLTTYIASTYILQKGFLKPLSSVQKVRSSLMSQIMDYVQGQETIRSFRRNTPKMELQNKKISRREKIELKLIEKSSWLLFSQNLIFLSAFLFLFIMAFIDIKNSHITIGDFVMIQTYLFNVFAPIKYIGILIEDIIKSSIDFINIKPFVENETTDTKMNPKENERSKPSFFPIKFENVSFIVGDKEILKNINFTINQNTTTALVGRNGSGKSTLLKLMLGLFAPSRGKIKLGVQELNSSNEVRSDIFSVVPQDLHIFTDTIKNNICFSTHNCDMDRLAEVCDMLDIHDWISQLDQKYDTVIGESGLRLSGGEKQLIAIARALYAQSQILLLDEATSNLDSKKEEVILEKVIKYFAGTIIIVSHRESIIERASNIIMLDQRTIVQQSSLTELLACNNFYFRHGTLN